MMNDKVPSEAAEIERMRAHPESEFLFLVHREWLDAAECKRRDQIADKHGVTFTQIKDPGGGWISWFSGPNLGDPFDRNLAARVREELGVGS